jgi:pimeloyl-ACP methyl ester carboxylesterase
MPKTKNNDKRTGLWAIATLGGSALITRLQTWAAVQARPPVGSFVRTRSGHLRVREFGQGQPVVLLHGAGGLLEDFMVAGVCHALAGSHRVIALDRPGYGYSSQPARDLKTPEEQAGWLDDVLDELGVERPILVGHSWGTLVALSHALTYPARASGLVLVSGFYYPVERPLAQAVSIAAAPGVGFLLRHTVLPPLARLIAPAVIRFLFAPSPVPKRFEAFPVSLCCRPAHRRAAAHDMEYLGATAAALCPHYRQVSIPSVLITGTGDKVVDPEHQTKRLWHDLPHAGLVELPGVGHMAHHVRPEAVVSAVKRLTRWPAAISMSMGHDTTMPPAGGSGGQTRSDDGC